MTELKIDPEFRDKIPPIPVEDFNGLRDDILRDGYVRDPLTVWKEENILLDGHHRWKIIQENPALEGKYKIDYRSFPDRYACIAWICANQLHKHNMNELQQAYLLKEEYEARRHSEKFKGNQYTAESGGDGFHHNQTTSLIDGKEIPLTPSEQRGGKTRYTLAKEHGLTTFAVQSAVEIGKGIDAAEEVSPGFKQEVLSGKVKAKKNKLAELRKMEPEERKQAVEAIKTSKPFKASKQKNGKIDIADKPYHEYSEQDAVDEVIVMGDEFIAKMERMLHVRSKVTMHSKVIANLIEEISDRVLNLKGEIKCQ